jgi:hypothetical protein
MSNPAFDWIKKHPAISASVAGGVGIVVWLLSRSGSSGSSSDLATVANAQLQQASLNTQNEAVQAQAQVAENQAALQTQATNNQAAAALAATVAQYNAQNTEAQTEANAVNLQTTTTGQVQDTLINAELAAQQSQVNAETNLVNKNYAYQTSVATSVLPSATADLLTPSNISANATNIIDTILGSPTAATAASASNVGYNAASQAGTASIVNSVAGGLSNIFSGLFA